MPVLNPFLYGKPVPATRFVGRQEAVRTVFSRLFNGESTAIVGEPHIGKSSLLYYVADAGVRAEWLGGGSGSILSCRNGLPYDGSSQHTGRFLAQRPGRVAPGCPGRSRGASMAGR